MRRIRLMDDEGDGPILPAPDVQQDVRDFWTRMGFHQPTRPISPMTGFKHNKFTPNFQARLEKLHEEFQEIMDSESFADVVDGHVDLIYVAIGNLIHMGVDFDRVWRIVQAANMRKEPMPNNEGAHRGRGTVKPDEWEQPDVEGELRTMGWRE